MHFIRVEGGEAARHELAGRKLNGNHRRTPFFDYFEL
jgi:hypothetical protein